MKDKAYMYPNGGQNQVKAYCDSWAIRPLILTRLGVRGVCNLYRHTGKVTITQARVQLIHAFQQWFSYFFCVTPFSSYHFFLQQEVRHWLPPLQQMSAYVSMLMQTKQGKRLGWAWIAMFVELYWSNWMSRLKFYFAVSHAALCQLIYSLFPN